MKNSYILTMLLDIMANVKAANMCTEDVRTEQFLVNADEKLNMLYDTLEKLIGIIEEKRNEFPKEEPIGDVTL